MDDHPDEIQVAQRALEQRAELRRLVEKLKGIVASHPGTVTASREFAREANSRSRVRM